MEKINEQREQESANHIIKMHFITKHSLLGLRLCCTRARSQLRPSGERQISGGFKLLIIAP